MFAFAVGNLVLDNISALVLGLASLIFVGSFLFVSITNDNKGMMRWIFNSNDQPPDQ